MAVITSERLVGEKAVSSHGTPHDTRLTLSTHSQTTLWSRGSAGDRTERWTRELWWAWRWRWWRDAWCCGRVSSRRPSWDHWTLASPPASMSPSCSLPVGSMMYLNHHITTTVHFCSQVDLKQYTQHVYYKLSKPKVHCWFYYTIELTSVQGAKYPKQQVEATPEQI